MPQQEQIRQTPPGRKNSDFLSAFEFYARDNFIPEIFNTWVGISIIAGALERKVWLEWNPTLRYYPNMYVMLVSAPGQGKSTALNKGFGLLRDLQKQNKLHFLPSQVTEAKLIELMGRRGHFIHEGVSYEHVSAFYFASEASDSLKEIYGDITSTMTNLYDCPDFWQKATKKDGTMTIQNACFNILAGSTFDYLGKLISDSNIMGGFASRITYIISKDEFLRDTVFPSEANQLIQDTVGLARQNLAHDLSRINEMTGPFRSEPGFGAAWREWDQASQKRRMSFSSEKMKSLLVRQGTSMHKLCMILSASESSDRILKVRHLEKAAALLAATEVMLPQTFREARAQNNQSADGMRNAIMSIIERKVNITKRELNQALTVKGFEPKKITDTLVAYLANGTLAEAEDGKLKLLVNPNDNL